MRIERECLTQAAIPHELEADAIDKTEFATIFSQKRRKPLIMEPLIHPNNRDPR